jgi:hypothetical protein
MLVKAAMTEHSETEMIASQRAVEREESVNMSIRFGAVGGTLPVEFRGDLLSIHTLRRHFLDVM